MFTGGTFNVSAGSSVVDLFSFLVTTVASYGTPDCLYIVKNSGVGTVRVGPYGAMGTTNGWKIGPGEELSLEVRNPDRLGIVGDQGAAASDITVYILNR